MVENGSVGTLSRRQVLRAAALGGGTSALAALLAACGGSSNAPTATTKSTTQGNPSPQTTGSAEPTAVPQVGATTAAQAPKSGTVLQIGRASEINAVWSPLRAATGTQSQVFDLIFNRLVKFDTDLKIIPDLAERFEISPEAKTFTFYLRRDVKWTDGQPFTARDVIFTYKLAMTKAAAARQYGKLSQITGAKDFYDGKANNITGLEMPDDYTVKFTLDKPNVAFLVGVSHSNSLIWILPEHILKDMDPAQIDKHPFTQNPNVGTGPYTWVQYVPDQFVEFKATPNYFAGSPKIEKVFLRLAAPVTALAQLERGELDVMSQVTPGDAERLKTQQQLTIFPAPGVGVFQTAINNERFKDNRVRQAFYYAVDREALIKVVLRGQGRLVNSTIIGPAWATYNDLNPYTYNPDKAKQLLKDAGWDPERKVEVIWSQGFQAIELAAPVFQQQLKEVGVNIMLNPLQSNAYIKKIINDVDYDLGWFSGGVYGMDPDVSSPYYESNNFTPAGANTTHYSNPAVDTLFVQGRGTTDQGKRADIYHQVAKTLNADVPTIFWWSENIIWGINKRVSGIKPGLNPDIQWNIQEWALSS